MLRRMFGKEEEKTQDELKLEESLQKTRSGIFGRIGAIFQENEITEELWEELEETLIMGDLGMDVTMDLVEATRAACRARGHQVDQGRLPDPEAGDGPPAGIG